MERWKLGAVKDVLAGAAVAGLAMAIGGAWGIAIGVFAAWGVGYYSGWRDRGWQERLRRLG